MERPEDGPPEQRMLETSRTRTRRLRLFLRDFRVVEANASFADGQSLAHYLAQRRAWVTLLDAHWPGTGDRSPVIVLRVQQILWIETHNGEVPAVTSSAAPNPRGVDVRLDGGLVLRGWLPMMEGQRLADYLESAGGFVPLMEAHLLRSGRPPRKTNVVLRDVAINRDAIQTVSEAEKAPTEPLL
jgi:hypothetical protein